jgi:glutathione peroxidase
LQEQFGPQGFTVLAFPCNQFGQQEPGTDAEVLAFARSTYDVNFPMFSKVDVNGDSACDLYAFLTTQRPQPSGEADIAWNFTKFLVDRGGHVAERFEPMVTPEEIAEVLPGYL